MVCLHLLFLYSKLLIAHYIWIQKETPTSKFKENSQSQNTWVYLGALPAQVGGKELICMVINCILSSTKMIIWVLLAFCGTVRAFPGTASFLGIRLWALGILCDFTASFTWLSGGLCSHRAVTQGRVGRCWQWPQLPGKGREGKEASGELCCALDTLCLMNYSPITEPNPFWSHCRRAGSWKCGSCGLWASLMGKWSLDKNIILGVSTYV